MSNPLDPVYRTLWTENLEEVDREIARLAVVCRVKLLEPGVVARVLKRDASVCGAPNAAAFAKLHGLIRLHFGIREKSLESFGSTQTAASESYVVDRLSKSFADLPGEWPARATKTDRRRPWRLLVPVALCGALALCVALLPT